MEPLRDGEQLDRYVVEAEIGVGGHARVYRVRHVELGLIRALKVLLTTDPGLTSRLLSEGRALASIRHPNVVEVFDVLRVGEQPALVMEFVGGGALSARITGASLDFPEVHRLFRGICAGVGSAHAKGVIHRDIKPDNVILEGGGGLKLIDLGVARLPHLEALAAPDIPGTPSYLAPELYAGDPGDERSDIFALGVTLYRAFAGGAYPYGDVEAFATPQHRRLAPLSQYRPDLPAWLETTLAKSLAPDPAERFQDAFELAYELEKNALSSAPARLRRRPLYERDPLRFWQVAAIALFLLLLASLAAR